MIIENNKITASKGYTLRRISDGMLYGNEAYLGYTYYLYGAKLANPYIELPEHFEEVLEVEDESMRDENENKF